MPIIKYAYYRKIKVIKLAYSKKICYSYSINIKKPDEETE